MTDIGRGCSIKWWDTLSRLADVIVQPSACSQVSLLIGDVGLRLDLLNPDARPHPATVDVPVPDVVPQLVNPDDSLSDGKIGIRLDYGARDTLGGMVRTDAYAHDGDRLRDQRSHQLRILTATRMLGSTSVRRDQ